MNCLPTIFLALVAGHAVMALAPSRACGQSTTFVADSIQAYEKEVSALQHILEGATVDWDRLRYSAVRSWIIGNPALRDSLFYALMAVDSSVQSEAGAEALVLATPSDDLIEVRFGNAVFKGMTLQNAIDKSGNRTLYQDIAGSYRYSKDIEMRDPAFTLETDYEPELLTTTTLLDYFTPLAPASYRESVMFRSDLSLSGLRFRAGPDWGGEYKIGNEEINFPFWTSGKMAFLATYKGIKLGFELPFTGGLNPSDGFPPFVVRPRKLNGTRGIVGEFDFGPFGGKFSFTRLTDSDLNGLTNPGNFYYITNYAQAWFSFGVELSPTHVVRVKAGGGTHRVSQAGLSTDVAGVTTVVPGSVTDFVSPWLKFEYLNHVIGETFRISLQYYDVTLVSTAYLEAIENLLGFEILYVWPLAADIPEWQNPEFLILTPHLYINF